jgi:hypothetical protein
LADLENSSGSECVNSWWSNYNKHTNVSLCTSQHHKNIMNQ